MHGPAIRVLVTAFAPVPGSSPHASALIGMAAALHAELDLVTVKTEDLSHLERVGAGRMFRVPVGFGSAAEQRETFGRAVVRQLQAQPYDVAHARGPIEGRLMAERRRELGFRFVYEVASFPDEAEGQHAETSWWEAHQLCADEADLILVPTEAAARSLGEQGHAGKVAVVHPGVDVSTFDWWPAGEGAATRILYLGSFEADRDLSTVLGAIRRVSRERPLEVMVAGEPDVERRHRLRPIVDAFDLSDIVHVRGEPTASALPSLIGASDLCLAPASATPRFQDFGDLPQPLLEYLACRRPVVAAGVPGVAEVLRDEKEALLYLPGDEESLTDAIMSLVEDETLREQLVTAAYERARQHFSVGARRRRIAEVYEMLVRGSQRYDAWNEAFEEENTGDVRVTTDLIPMDSDLGESEPPFTYGGEASASAFGPSDPGEVLYVPGEEGSVAPPGPAHEGEDTNPGVDYHATDVSELSASPTVVTQKVSPDVDPDGGPTRAK